MITAPEILRCDLVYHLGWSLLHSLWQIALLASVVAALLAAFRRRSANLRYVIGCAGLGVMFVLPVVTYCVVPAPPRPELAAVAIPPCNPPAVSVDPLPLRTGPPQDRLVSTRPPESEPSAPSVAWESLPLASRPSPELTPSAEPATRLPARVSQALLPWVPWFVMSWLVGVFLLSVWHLGGWIAMQRLKYLGTTPGSELLTRQLAELIGRLRLARPVRMLQSVLVDVPAVIGWLRPVLLVPAAMLGELSPQQIDAVLAHELAHVRRYDYLVNLLQTLIETLLFYHPAVWWLSRRVRIERENCCDDAAIALCGSRVDYAAALTALEQGRLTPRLAVAAKRADRAGTALSRVRRVLGLSTDDARCSRCWPGGSAAVLLLVAVLMTCMALGREKEPAKPLAAEVVAKQSAEGSGAESLRPAHVELVLDKVAYFLGENVLLHYGVTNSGEEPLVVNFGGDSRSSPPRPLRFKVVATDENGKPVEDPYPAVMSFGGPGGETTLKPGETFWASLPLMLYCDFDKPGTYKVRVYHDLGWEKRNWADNTMLVNALPKGPHRAPIVETTIKLMLPNPEQARRVVTEMLSLSTDAGPWGRRAPPRQDVTVLRHPVYLPIVEELARRGSRPAVTAVGSIPTPEATRALIRLLDCPDRNVADESLESLLWRLPRPVLPGQPSGENQQQRLARRAWRDEMRPEVLEVGWRLLAKQDRPSLIKAARILQCLGRPSDFPRFIKELDRVLEEMKNDPTEQDAYPRPANASGSMIQAGWQLIERGAAVPTDPQTPGQAALFMMALGHRADFRPADWQATAARLLRHPIPYVRSVTLENLRSVPLGPLGEAVIPLLSDKHLAVSVPACDLAGATKAELYRQPLLEVLRAADDQWLMQAAHRAALACGAERDRVLEISIDQLGRPRPADSSIYPWILDLLIEVVQREGGWGHSNTDWSTAGQLATQWRRLLEANREQIRAGKLFKIGEPPLKPELFPRGFQFQRKDGRPWPDWSRTPAEADTPPAEPAAADEQTAWGPAVEGVQVRLRAEQSKWTRGNVPRLAADVRNGGQRDLTVAQSQELCELEVDGRWYRWVGDIAVKSSWFPPGRQYDSIPVSLGSPWASDGKPLTLEPGKHAVRVTFIASPRGSDSGNPVKAVSNPVEIEVVAAQPDKSAAKLLEDFRTAKESWIQAQAARKLIALGDKSILPEVAQMLKSEDRRTRCNAGWVLARLGDERGLSAVLAELKDAGPRPTKLIRSDGKPNVPGQIEQDRYYAVHVLGEIGDRRAAPELIEALKDDSINYKAAIVLGNLGDRRAIPALKQMLKECQPDQRLWAGSGLAKLGDPLGIPTVAEFLKHPQWTQRRHAADALGESQDKRAVAPLIDALKDKQAEVRVSAARALGRLADQSAIPALEALLDDHELTTSGPPTAVRDAAAEAIRQIRGAAPPTAQAASQPKPRLEGEQSTWGPAFEGMQVRLRAGQSKWTQGTVPRLAADVRNSGKRDLSVAQAQELCELEVDGRWHRWAGSIRVKSSWFPPGRQYDDIVISLGSPWASDGKPLTLEPGKHAVRVAFVASPTEDDGGKPVRAVSKPVEIEIVADTIQWGPNTNGLQAGLAFDVQERPYHVGELVSFRLYVRNLSGKTIELVDFGTTGWMSTVRDGAGKSVVVAGVFDGPVQRRRQTLPDGQTLIVGTVALMLDKTPEARASQPFHAHLAPGTYRVSQKYRFAADAEATWSGELASGELELTVVSAPDAGAEVTDLEEFRQERERGDRAKDFDTRLQHYRKALQWQSDYPEKAVLEYRVAVMLKEFYDSRTDTWPRREEALAMFRHIVDSYDHMEYYTTPGAGGPWEAQVAVPNAAVRAASLLSVQGADQKEVHQYLSRALEMMNETCQRRIREWSTALREPPPDAFDGPLEQSKWQSRVAEWERRKKAAAEGEVLSASELETVKLSVPSIDPNRGGGATPDVLARLRQIAETYRGTPIARIAQQRLEAGKGDPGVLLRQLNAGELSDEKIRQITDEVLAIQGDLEQPWDPAWGNWLEKARVMGEVSDADFTRYAKQSNPTWQMEFNYAMNEHSGRVGLSFRYKHVGGRVASVYTNHSLIIKHRLVRLSLGDLPLDVGGRGGEWSFVAKTGHGAGFFRVPEDIDGLEKLQPGKYEAVLVLEAEIYETGRPDKTLHHCRIELTDEVQLAELLFLELRNIRSWGEAVDGVQCRLEADKPTWKAGEAPTLKAYVRHQTETRLFLSNHPSFGAQLEVDGHWHRWNGPLEWAGPSHSSSKLRTKDAQPLKITLDENWKQVENKQPLQLDPGRHVLRFAWEGHPERGPHEGPDEQRNLVLTSNPVEITILPERPEPKPAETAFGPVIERIVSFSFMEDAAHLDLDTGKQDRSEPRKDLIAAAGESDGRVRSGLDMVAIPVDASRWNASPDEILADVAKAEPQRHVRLGGPESRRTFFFKTREGGVGVLRIVPMNEGQANVKVLYKLLLGTGKQTTWGPAVEGVQCRLEADKPTWKPAEMLTLKAYVRHQTETTLFLSNHPMFGAQLEVDGHWHRWNGPAPQWQGQAHGSSKFRTQDEQPLAITLDENWKQVDNKEPLRVDPGRHVIRFAWEGHPRKGPREGPDMTRNVVLMSNPLEMIVPPERPQPKPSDVHADDRNAAAALWQLGGILAADDQGKISSVRLSRTAVTDEDLGHLERLSGLKALYLDDTRINNAALQHLAGLAGLGTLSLNYTRVGDAGLEHLSGLKGLRSLALLDTEVTAAGLRGLKKALPELQTRVDPLKLSGLGDLRGWRNSAELNDDYELVSVDLLDANISDTSLELLKDRQSLQDVCLSKANITDAGLAELRKLTDLHTLYLSGTRITDAGLDCLKDMTKLKTLFLADTQIGDAGLARLSGLTNLESLLINGTQVTDAGMVHLKPLAKLTLLRLNDCQISGAGLSHLRALTKLTSLELYGTAVSDTGLIHLQPFVNLELLYLSHTSVTDAGLGYLTGLRKLRALEIQDTAITDEGIQWLKQALPNASIHR